MQSRAEKEEVGFLLSYPLRHTPLLVGRTSVPFRNGIPFWNVCVLAEKVLLYGPLHQDCVEKPFSSVGPYRRMPQPTHTFQNGIPFRNGSLAVP